LRYVKGGFSADEFCHSGWRRLASHRIFIGLPLSPPLAVMFGKISKADLWV